MKTPNNLFRIESEVKKLQSQIDEMKSADYEEKSLYEEELVEKGFIRLNAFQEKYDFISSSRLCEIATKYPLDIRVIHINKKKVFINIKDVVEFFALKKCSNNGKIYANLKRFMKYIPELSEIYKEVMREKND